MYTYIVIWRSALDGGSKRSESHIMQKARFRDGSAEVGWYSVTRSQSCMICDLFADRPQNQYWKTPMWGAQSAL